MVYLSNHAILTQLGNLLYKTLTVHLIPVYPKTEESLSCAKRKIRILFDITVF